MQIVISIDEDYYKNCVEMRCISTKELVALEKFISSGTPLPEVLDKITAEISDEYNNCDICEWFVDYDYDECDISEYRPVGYISDIINIINKYKAESEG